MSQEDRANTVPDEGFDDLSQLDGIGQRYAEALAQAGIRSFSDLVKYTPKTLSAALKERAGTNVSEKRIDTQNWIGQARQALGRKELPISTLPLTDESVDGHEDEWQEQEAFQIFIDSRELDGQEVWQTRVYEGTDGDESQLPGIDPDKWVNWILDHSKLPEVSQKTGFTAETSQPEIEVLQHERDELRLSLSEAQQEIQDARKRAETLDSQLQKMKTELDEARTMNPQARDNAERIAALEQELQAAQAETAEAKTKAASLNTVTQHMQAQVDAAFQALASAQGSRPIRAFDSRSESVNQTAQPQNTQVIAPQKPTAIGDKFDLGVKILDVIIEESASQQRAGSITFSLSGKAALLATKLQSSFTVEVRGVDPQGSSSTLLAKVDSQLSPNQIEYDLPFTLRIPKPGVYQLHTKLWLRNAGNLIAAAQVGKSIVQQSVSKPSTKKEGNL